MDSFRKQFKSKSANSLVDQGAKWSRFTDCVGKHRDAVDNQLASVFAPYRIHLRWIAQMLAVCLYVLISPPLTWAASLSAVEYQGAGYVDYKAFSPDTNQADRAIIKERWNFVFGVSNDLWRIRLNDPEKGIKVEYSYDGTNTYNAISTGTNMAAQIYPMQYPPPNGLPAIVVWFAYCSGSYISNTTNNLLCSLSQEAHPYVTAYGRPVRSKLGFLDASLHIPRRCLEFSDGAIYGIDVTKRPPIIVGYRFGGVFRNGFVESTYNVGETTNVSGLTLPRAFQLQQFRPRGGSASSNDVFVVAEFDGCLQSIELGASDAGNGVKVQPNAIVADYRGMKLDPPVELVQYLSPSNSWLPFSPGSMPYAIYENSRHIQKTSVTQSHSKRALVVAVLIVLTASPLICIWAWRFFVRTFVNEP